MRNLFVKILLLALVGNAFTGSAQKLPSEQTAAVALPANFKIDGLANEWNNQFQAHNNSTEVNYTMANDGQSLYLAVQATQPLIMKKIIGGGITFAIHASGGKKDATPFTITFPLVENSYQLSVFNTINVLATELVQQRKDSLINAANKKMETLVKDIKAKGFTALDDTLLSIYNTTGIKAAVLINANGALICEFLVPLKFLGINPGNANPIAYNVIINGISSIIRVTHANGTTAIGIPHALSSNPADFNSAQYATDFWGTYSVK